MRAHTPLLRQYFETKQVHPDTLLAMRVGDFYEFYGPDAETAAAALEITLTGREDGPNGRVAMAGVPFHSVEKYLARLVERGMKVALCDQIEDPKQAKGLVRRAVTRVLTPGTVLEETMLRPGQNTFLAGTAKVGERIGLAVLDSSTGEFMATELGTPEALIEELGRLRPAELLFDAWLEEAAELASRLLGGSVRQVTPPAPNLAEDRLARGLGVSHLGGFGLTGRPAATVAAEMVRDYAAGNGLDLAHLDGITTYAVEGFMALDLSTRRSLELTANLADGSRSYTLISILDRTSTPMGGRSLRRWIEAPLLDRDEIRLRQDAVATLVGTAIFRGDLRDELAGVADIERLVARSATGLAGPRDLAGLRLTLKRLPVIARTVELMEGERLRDLAHRLHPHAELLDRLSRGLVDDPPATLREGGIIRDGYHAEIDRLRSLSKDGRSEIAAIETRERERTGIATLKVGYNAVFGYYIEIGKSRTAQVPEDYVRKQTTTNAERYITAELKEIESAVLGAGERLLGLEAEQFAELRSEVAAHSRTLLFTARALAELDVLTSLAEVAATRGYVRPEIVEEDVCEIVKGRHPVVEAETRSFVPNDLHLGATRLVVLTGPNMSGKSTFLRQTALIALMAQIGSFVPAASARLGLCDRIFARIGAKDELALGQSTFMVEMLESAHILNHAGERSLVILDEVGRGTSTYDGMAIAWAMVEHLAEVRAKTLFATHYHQLNALADQLEGVANYRVAVEEDGDDIVWTHRVLPGGTDRSYGIHVARMAGMPRRVLRRAGEILAGLEQTEAVPRSLRPTPRTVQLTLFEAEDPEVVKRLRELDVNELTPLQALALLEEWQRKFS